MVEKLGTRINRIANGGADAVRSLTEPRPQIPADAMYVIPLMKGLGKGLEGIAKLTGGRKTSVTS